ncbi:hypothetical protein DFH29DRAFT_870872 [Suillus ampliporus]|nr:hypothetical protein DFH29DRAFT_870872 [Suillus ampliporus]
MQACGCADKWTSGQVWEDTDDADGHGKMWTGNGQTDDRWVRQMRQTGVERVRQAPAKANAVQPEHQCAHSPHPFLHTAHHSDRFGFKLPSATDSQDLAWPSLSQNKTSETATKPDMGNHTQ